MRVIASLFVLCFSVSLEAQSTASYTALHEYFERVWSPYCKGNSLMECPSGQAQELRDQLTEMYDQGASFDELTAALKAQYGDQVYMLPDQEDRGRLAYFIPWLVFFVACLVTFVFWAKRSAGSRLSKPPRESNSTAQSDTPIAGKVKDRLDEELHQRLS